MKKSILLAFFLVILLSVEVQAFSVSNIFTDVDIQRQMNDIDQFIQKMMKKGNIPGLSVAIIKDGKPIYMKGFGYSDLKTKEAVTKDTLFEIGSNSKAFTALAVYQLAEKGLVSINAPVSKYLPWFRIYTNNNGMRKSVDITIGQLLHHTSGIPFSTISQIPETNENNALERTVRTLVGNQLEDNPGENFQYASINYDILGLIIQKVSNTSYEEYMYENILKPLKLNKTYMFREDAVHFGVSKGYKVGFLRPIEYSAPIYRGNCPAGYIISNAEDMGKWLQIQLGTYNSDSGIESLVERTHIPDRTVPPSIDGSSYSGGWSVFQSGSGEFSHEGSNPNFSSFLAFRPEGKIGVAVLANIDSSFTTYIGQDILNTLTGRKPVKVYPDQYATIDKAAFTLLLISFPFILVTLYFLVVFVIQLIRHDRKLEKKKTKLLVHVISSLAFISIAAYCFYELKSVLFSGLPWNLILVWGPSSLFVAIPALFFGIVIFCIYLTLTSVFPHKDDKNVFPLIVLSSVSGLGNALLVFILDQGLNANDGIENKLLLYFLFSMIIYILGQKVVRTKVVTITNNLIYTIRAKMINKILNVPFQKIEAIDIGKIQASLNNDTETISNNAASVLVTAFTDITTFVCCLIYLGIINLVGLLFSISVILTAAALYYIAGRTANALWEQTRDIQNVFFKYINDMVYGFKELSIKYKKRNEFKNDMVGSCYEYKEKRIKGGLKFANVFIIGELLFSVVLGGVTFLFPSLVKNVEKETIKSFVIVLLFMTGPLHGILNSIPNIIQIRISLNRLKEFEQCISPYEVSGLNESNVIARQGVSVELKNVEYRYHNENNENFLVGPLNCIFKSGEITFITGGNGSGKSTLAKLITGLYPCSNGQIFLNGNETDTNFLGEYYSVVFSDYYLFKKMYGIDYEGRSKEIDELMKLLHIDGKVEAKNGEFSTIKLSSGQRKRLALLLCYLEDYPIYMFDEWAADQDPEFRDFFYCELLPELKNKGKCVIAITHDDRYFYVADRVVKMDMGKIICDNPKIQGEHANTESGAVQALA